MKYLRRIIRIRAEDSPNVRAALARIRRGESPDGPLMVPGVLPYADYVYRRSTWDAMKQCVGLDAMFYEGAEVLMYPADWLNRAERLADGLGGQLRSAVSVGVDPAEGGDETSMVAVDRLGVVALAARKTPDTSQIPGEALAFAREHGAAPDSIVFDAGGGGKEHADHLRSMGYAVRTVPFGSPPVMELKRGLHLLEDRRDHREEKYVFVSRRAQMYHELRQLLDPSAPGFAIPAQLTELRRQLSPIPVRYDREGRIRMLPKHRQSKDSKEETLTDLIGCSPDQADALVLAVHGMLHRVKRAEAGAI